TVASKRQLLTAMAKRDLAPFFAHADHKRKGPLHIEQMEWFASPNDLCRLALQLDAAGPDLKAILSINPGIPDAKSDWTYIGCKGGKDAGVFEITWLPERARDGKKLFFAAAFNNPDAAIDESAALAAVAAARAFLATVP